MTSIVKINSLSEGFQLEKKSPKNYCGGEVPPNNYNPDPLRWGYSPPQRSIHSECSIHISNYVYACYNLYSLYNDTYVNYVPMQSHTVKSM